MTLTLFPVRAPIGQVTDANGRTYDVMMTPEFARALSSLGERLGGMTDPSGLDLAPIESGGGDALAARVAELEQQIAGLQAALAQVTGADVYTPPAVERNYFPVQWPTKNPRGNGSWADLWVPDQKTFVDNVLSLRNNSRSASGDIYGLAAICMLDASGKERGAFGYSRNGAIQPAGYYADTVYVEYGDPFSGDNNPSSYKLICTMAATSPWFPGTSFVAMEANAKTGATVIRARGGQPISLAGGYTLTEDASIGYTGNVRQLLGGMGGTSWRIRERDTTDYCGWTTNMNDAGAQDDPLKPSWKVAQGAGIDEFRVARSPAGVNAFVNFLRIDAQGRATFTGGGAIGYGAGSGGTAVQPTNKNGIVTLNKPSGQVTMNAAALAAGAAINFQLTNSTIADGDTVVVNIDFSAPGMNYQLWVYNVFAGGCSLILKNISAVSLSEAVVFNFAVIKASLT